ncbi:MAG: VWA-like domain-containing protein [Lachnospiraceae bacterium]|nr:VWA-like domain-containing protein [Lachnospiraceae bacterium]
MSIIYDEQTRELAFEEIARDILRSAQNELYLNMRFLDVALSSLVFLPDQQIRTLGTDGEILYFQPDALADVFRKSRESVNRLYLHSILHCLFAHLWVRKDRDPEYWNLACDIAVEHVIDGLYICALHQPGSALRRELYRVVTNTDTPDNSQKPLSVQKTGGASSSVPTAQRIYRCLCKIHPDPAQLDRLKREFAADDHSRWEDAQKRSTPSPQQKHWEDIRDRMQTEMETFGKESSDDVKALEKQICAANRKHYDYREFLRKFAVLKEEMQVDPESFDYIFYNYGMEMYCNMPLIEPLETKEIKKVEDFVIVLDTSMSCKGDLLLRFLKETYNILSESESFFRKIHVHILQCDDKVQEDVLITNSEEMKNYLEHFTVRGFGGTDFRPPFARVQELMRRQCFTKLRGLIYFTDGYGTFPVKKPPYETAFVFLREDYRDVDVPPWAIKLILDSEDLEGNPDRREQY